MSLPARTGEATPTTVARNVGDEVPRGAAARNVGDCVPPMAAARNVGDCVPPVAAARGDTAAASSNTTVHFESPYLATAFPLGLDSPSAHVVSLFAYGRFGQEAIRARLVADPNVCELNDYGDRIACTHLATRVYEVALTRLRAPSPVSGGRTVFAVTGADVPDGVTLVVHPQGNRVYLKRERVLVPLYLSRGVLGV